MTMRGLLVLVGLIVGAFVLAVVVAPKLAGAPAPTPVRHPDDTSKLTAEIERQRVAYDSQEAQAEADRMTNLREAAANGRTPGERRAASRALKKLEETANAAHEADDKIADFTAHVTECCNTPASLQSSAHRAQCAAWGVSRCAGDR